MRNGNVLSFGADPTGASDSTKAFQDAENSGLPVYVPNGNWRIDGTIILDKGTVWNFEQGVLPNYRWHTMASQAYWDRFNSGCRLFKDNNSGNVPFFKCRSGWVFLLGHPLLDVGLRDSFTSDGVLYAMSEANELVQQTSKFAYPRIWGGSLEIQALGNYATITNPGEGIRMVRVDWGDQPIPDNLDNGYTTKLDWKLRGQLINIAAEIETKADLNQWSNSGFIHIETHGAKRSFHNDGTNDVRVSGYHQCSNVLDATERHFPVLYFGPATRENAYNFEFHDLGPSADVNGHYRNNVPVEDYGWNTLELLQGAPTRLPHVGTIVRNQRKAYDNTNLGGIVSTFENNVLANLGLRVSHAGGSFSWGVFAGEEVDDFGSLINDSVTAGVTSSQEFIETAGSDMTTLAHSYSDKWLTLKFSKDAVIDGDYLEYHWTGWRYSIEKLILAFSYRGRLQSIQYIGKNKGTVVENIIFNQALASGSTASRPEVIELQCSGRNVDEGILRFIGPSASNTTFSITDFAGIDTTPKPEGHWLSQKGGQVCLGGMTFAGDMVFEKDINMNALPTSDPHIPGRIWSNNGVLTVSIK